MSHYSKVKTKLRNIEALIKALQDMGFTTDMIQHHKNAVQLEGYRGDKRSQTAEVVLPRRFVGGAANDIGFKLQEDGTYEAIISDFDRSSNSARRSQYWKSGAYNENWLKKLNQRYAYHNLKEELSEQGFFIESESEENGELFLEVGSSLWG